MVQGFPTKMNSQNNHTRKYYALIIMSLLVWGTFTTKNPIISSKNIGNPDSSSLMIGKEFIVRSKLVNNPYLNKNTGQNLDLNSNTVFPISNRVITSNSYNEIFAKTKNPEYFLELETKRTDGLCDSYFPHDSYYDKTMNNILLTEFKQFGENPNNRNLEHTWSEYRFSYNSMYNGYYAFKPPKPINYQNYEMLEFFTGNAGFWGDIDGDLILENIALIPGGVNNYYVQVNYVDGRHTTYDLPESVEKAWDGFIKDIDNDGKVEIFVGARTSSPMVNTLKVYVFDDDGTIIKVFQRTGGWHYDGNGIVWTANKQAGIHPLDLLDVDNDGELELLVLYGAGGGLKPRGIGAINYETGKEEWWYDTGPNSFGGAIGDINKDGLVDILYGSVTHHNGGEGWGVNGTGTYTNDGHLYMLAISGNGSDLWSMITNHDGVFQIAYDDIFNDGNFEILVLELKDQYYDGEEVLYMFDSTGELLGSYKIGYSNFNPYGSISIADVNGDGSKEIIVSTTVTSRTIKVLVLSKELELIVQRTFGYQVNSGQKIPIWTSDVDGDDLAEILIAVDNKALILNGDLNTEWCYEVLNEPIVNIYPIDVLPGEALELAIEFINGTLKLLHAWLPQISVPSSPRNLKATVLSDGIVLNWSAPLYDGGTPITGYNVYRGLVFDGPYEWIEMVNNTSFYDLSVNRGVTYYYVVTAINSVGESSLSNEARATLPLIISIPSPPRDLKAMPYKNKILLNWSAPSNDGGSPITGYNVYRGLASGGPYVLIDTVTLTIYADTNILLNQTYYYVVTALNIAGESNYSNEANAMITYSPPIYSSQDNPSINVPIPFAWSFIGLLSILIIKKKKIRRI